MDEWDLNAEKLREYAGEEGTEFGEYAWALIALYNQSYTHEDEELLNFVAKKIKECLDYFEQNYEWEEVIETQEVKYRKLVYKG